MTLKLLLKRGALLAVANWQAVAIQFFAETTFQVLLAVPIFGAAILVAVAVGADLGDLLQGNLREIATNIARALTSEPMALGSLPRRVRDRPGWRVGADVSRQRRDARRAARGERRRRSDRARSRDVRQPVAAPRSSACRGS